MTGRERVEAMFERGEQDRIPRYDAFWPETLRRWRDEGMPGHPSELFSFDIGAFGHVAPVPFPGRREVTEEDGGTYVLVDEYGSKRRFWRGRSGTPQHLGWECTSPDIWQATFRPRYQPARIAIDVDALAPAYAAAREAERWASLGSRGPYIVVQTLLGDECVLMAMASEPTWIAEMMQVVTDAFLTIYQQVIDAGMAPDSIWIHDDLAYTHAPFMSPRMYRELIWPSHRRIAEFAHQHDARFIFHTDGDVRSLIDLFVEAGADCLQPLEAKAHMDVRELAPRVGDRLAFMGNIDAIVLIGEDRDAIDAEIASKLAAGMATRGYCYHSDHSVPSQVSWETYQFVMERVEHYGRYA